MTEEPKEEKVEEAPRRKVKSPKGFTAKEIMSRYEAHLVKVRGG